MEGSRGGEERCQVVGSAACAWWLCQRDFSVSVCACSHHNVSTYLSCAQNSVVPSLAAATHSRHDPSSWPLLTLTRPPAWHGTSRQHDTAQASVFTNNTV